MTGLDVHLLGTRDYSTVYSMQKSWTEIRGDDKTDELWCLEHTPVYTLGLAGKMEHILNPGIIPVLKTDRGGQVTYHGPGQLVMYPLIDLKRKGISIRNYVHLLEQATIDMLCALGINAERKDKAPGVYVNQSKIAALGVRVRRGCCYHGLSLNVSMDLLPFQGINPCGYPGLAVTQLADLGVEISVESVADMLIPYITRVLDYDEYRIYGSWNGQGHTGPHTEGSEAYNQEMKHGR